MGRRDEFGLGHTEFEMQFKIEMNLKKSRGEPRKVYKIRAKSSGGR